MGAAGVNKVAAIKTSRDEWAESCVRTAEEAVETVKSTPHESIVLVRLSRDGDIAVRYSTMDRVRLVGHLMLAVNSLASMNDA